MGEGESIDSVSQGTLYWAWIGGNRHPIVIVSRDNLNHGDYIVTIPFSTKRIEYRRGLANCVFFDSGDFGLPYDCVAMTEAIGQMTKSDIDFDTGPMGVIDPEVMRELIKAVGYTIDSDCEPR